MDALAVRLGRVEAGLAGLRQEVFSLQVTSGPEQRVPTEHDVGSVHPGHAGEVVAEWVRLFEKELEAVRKRLEDSKGVEARLQQLEHGFSDNQHLANDLDELSELMLEELRGLQEKVQALSRNPGTWPAEDAGRGPPGPGSGADADHPIVTGSLRRRHAELSSRLEELERHTERAGVRLERLEAELMPCAAKDGGPEGSAMTEKGPEGHEGPRHAASIARRIERLEHDVQVGLSPQLKAASSLRILEETDAKVRELQKAVAAAHVDGEVGHAMAAVQDLEATARRAAGTLTVLDAHRMQASLEQVMAAMEALTRQRNDDIRLMNSYLADFHTRIRDDMIKEACATKAATFRDLRMEVSSLSAQLEGLTTTELKELQARVLHESQVASEAASACNTQLAEFKGMMARVMEHSADVDVRLKGLLESSDHRAAVEARSETFAMDIQRDVARLSVEIAELAACSRSGSTIEADARLVAVRAELEAQMDQQAQDAGRRIEVLESEVQAWKQRHHELEAAAGNAGLLRGDLERLVRDTSALRKDAARADVELRDRVAQGEHELRAEVRAAQRLVLELAEQLGTDRRLPAVDPSAAAADARAPRLRDAEEPRAGAPARGHEAAERDVGTLLALSDSAVEWRVPGVRARARAGDARALVSAPFSVPRFPGGPALRLKLFPLGSRRRTRPGHCSLYVSGPEGAHLQFLLRLGGLEHGPLECLFDRPDKDTGRHDFGALEEELEADGGSVVRLTVLRAAAPGQGPGGP